MGARLDEGVTWAVSDAQPPVPTLTSSANDRFTLTGAAKSLVPDVEVLEPRARRRATIDRIKRIGDLYGLR